MKQFLIDKPGEILESRPVRARGLKLYCPHTMQNNTIGRAPCGRVG